MRTRLYIFLSIAISLLAFQSCKSNDADVFASFSKTEDFVILNTDYSLPFKVGTGLNPLQKYDFAKNQYDATTTSSKPSVIQVIDCGTVRGVSCGTADVTIMMLGKSYKIKLTVVETDPGKPQNKDSLAVVTAPWNWTTAATGVTTGYASFNLFGKTASIAAAHYPYSKLKLSIVYHPGKECMTTSAAGSMAGAVVAINGSYFNTETLVASTFYATGGNAVCSSSLNERSNGIVGIMSNGYDVDIFVGSTPSFLYYASKYQDVIASGPVLLQSGKVYDNPHNDFNDTMHPRSIIGKDKDNNIWMITIDGRFPGQGEGASIEECSLICRYLGLSDAINLDGGGSSSLWTPSTGVLNHPCDNSKWDHAGERKDPTVFVAK